MIDLQLY